MPDPMQDPDDMRRYSNALRLEAEGRIGELTQRLASGEIDLATWQSSMKDELRRANLRQFVTGRGGVVDGVSREDYLALGPELKHQYAYLRRFAGDIAAAEAAGNSLAFAVSRAVLYARSTQAMFWKQAVPVKLPQIPRDGKTACRTNCKCRLRIQYVRDGQGNITEVLVFWRLGISEERCGDCKRLAKEWNPLRIKVGQNENMAETPLKVAENLLEQAIGLVISDDDGLPDVAAQHLYAMWGVAV